MRTNTGAGVSPAWRPSPRIWGAFDEGHADYSSSRSDVEKAAEESERHAHASDPRMSLGGQRRGQRRMSRLLRWAGS